MKDVKPIASVYFTLVLLVTLLLCQIGCHTTNTDDPGLQDAEVLIISKVNVIDIVDTAATVVWNTNEEATSNITWWMDKNADGENNMMVNSNDDYVTHHEMTIGGLVPGTAYCFEVQSENREGHTAVSEEGIFTTMLGQDDSDNSASDGPGQESPGSSASDGPDPYFPNQGYGVKRHFAPSGVTVAIYVSIELENRGGSGGVFVSVESENTGDLVACNVFHMSEGETATVHTKVGGTGWIVEEHLWAARAASMADIAQADMWLERADGTIDKGQQSATPD